MTTVYTHTQQFIPSTPEERLSFNQRMKSYPGEPLDHIPICLVVIAEFISSLVEVFDDPETYASLHNIHNYLQGLFPITEYNIITECNIIVGQVKRYVTQNLQAIQDLDFSKLKPNMIIGINQYLNIKKLFRDAS